MIGTLNHQQIALILSGQLVGRLGFRVGSKISVIPTAYVFQEGFIYAHSRESTKVKAMRKNPQVCFQVDCIDNMANWRSVVLWGEFEELTRQADRQKALQLIHDKISPFIQSKTTNLPLESENSRVIEKPRTTVVYRIKILEESGRFEKSDQ